MLRGCEELEEIVNDGGWCIDLAFFDSVAGQLEVVFSMLLIVPF